MASSVARPSTSYKLIAHRGGIVDHKHIQDSPASIQAAIDYGYWMLEVDIRRTKDGEPILHHNADFKHYYNDARKVADLTWKEISSLRSVRGNTSPIRFRDCCRMCRGKTRLMLDIKGEDFPRDFYLKLHDALQVNGLLDSVYLLGGADRAKAVFGKAGRRPCTRQSLAAALASGRDVRDEYYLFELASVLDKRSVELCRKAEIPAVAAVNTFRYIIEKRDPQKGAEEDVARMKQLGVTYYQIDSRYESLFS